MAMSGRNGAAGPKRRGKIVSLSEIAAIFGVARTTVYEWLDEGCPCERLPRHRGDSAELNTAKVHDWLVERAVERAVAGKRPRAYGDGPVENDEARERRLKADLLELKYERERGALLPAAEVARADQAVMAMIHDNMLAIPAAAAEALHDAALRDGPAGIEEVLSGYIKRALTDAAEAEFEAIEDGADHQGDGVEADGEDEESGAGAAEAAAAADDL